MAESRVLYEAGSARLYFLLVLALVFFAGVVWLVADGVIVGYGVIVCILFAVMS